jgi:hypothetical protein
MACSRCGKNKARKFQVKLPGGLTITKNTEAAAVAFAAAHPGSKVIKPA